MSKAGKIASLFGAGSTTINPALVVVPASVPPGTMVPFSGAAAPTDWLFCYGQAVSRATYAALFTAIGTTYGVGDGSTTFNLPDMRGRLAAGKDDMGGTAASRMSVTLTGTKASTSNGNITGLSSTAGLAVGMKAFGNPDEVGAAAVDYLRVVGHMTFAYFFAQAAKIALAKKDSGDPFYTAKLATARFYFAKLLPETASLIRTCRAGLAPLMEMEEALF